MCDQRVKGETENGEKSGNTTVSNFNSTIIIIIIYVLSNNN